MPLTFNCITSDFGIARYFLLFQKSMLLDQCSFNCSFQGGYSKFINFYLGIYNLVVKGYS